MEIVKLIGGDVLPDDQKLTLEIARVIRLGFAAECIPSRGHLCASGKAEADDGNHSLSVPETKVLVSMGMPMSVLREDSIFDKVISIKYDVENNRLDKFDDYKKAIDKFYDDVIARNA